MKIRLKPVKAYELLAPDGRAVARLVMADSWEGLAKLQTDSGQVLIIERPSFMEQTMAEALGNMGAGDGTIECDLVKASPSLAAELMGAPGDAV